jgi:hypothetical protein
MNTPKPRKRSAAQVAKMDLLRRAYYCPDARAALRAMYAAKAND